MSKAERKSIASLMCMDRFMHKTYMIEIIKEVGLLEEEKTVHIYI